MVDGGSSVRQSRGYRSQLRVHEAAMDIIRSSGWPSLTVGAVARAAGVSVGLVCRYFPTRDHFALSLYEQLADALATRAADLPAGTMAERFTTLLRWKLELLEPHRPVLVAVASAAIDPTARAGVLGVAAQRVRAKVAGLFDLVARGASDAPPGDGSMRIGRLLYAAHLALVLVWVQLPPGHALPLEAIAANGPALAPLLQMLAYGMDPTLQALLGAPTLPDEGRRADAIVDLLLRRRRMLDGSEGALPEMRALHGPIVQGKVDRNAPIEIVLPAFPAKAPNPHKVLGDGPDLAEWLALESLADLLDEIRAVYPPGAQLILCSDGGVFADLVGVTDAQVRAYRAELEGMIASISAARGGTAIRIFDLDDAFDGQRASTTRKLLMRHYGSTVEALQMRAKASPSSAQMIDGIHRFLFEDELVRSPAQSRTQSRKVTRARAYEVVLRSEAWGALVGVAFPEALRCSIHPQPAISSKLGIRLLDSDDAWLTPWHGAAVLVGEGYRLMKRADAEALGAQPRTSEDGLAFLEVPS